MITPIETTLKNPKIEGDLNILNPRNPMSKTLKQVDDMVEYLLQKLGSEAHIPLYRRAVWMLPDDVVRRHLANALERSKTNPRGYFAACVRREEGYYPPTQQ